MVVAGGGGGGGSTYSEAGECMVKLIDYREVRTGKYST